MTALCDFHRQTHSTKMSSQVHKCSVCDSSECTKWYFLDQRCICADCHDNILNPMLEPLDVRPIESESVPRVELDKPSTYTDDDSVAQHYTTTPKKTSSENHPLEDMLDVVLNAENGGIDEQDEMNDTISGLGMFSPRRLRRRVCPVRAPVRRVPKKNGRTCHGTKAKSRRTLTKKEPIKSPRETVSTKTVTKLLHENMWYQIGDIVSMVDTKDNTYYAQIRGLLVDAYNEKSAFLSWLLPTTASPPPNEAFDPATYLPGPDEDAPRRLTYLNFIMHAPSNYYQDRNNPYPRPECYGPVNTTQRENRNYVWATIDHLRRDDK
uniref:GATA zinc finger domain-containing protein 1 n=1 Tax=Anopheles farauti TaxID=69004 RepID=A0A182QY41_9DIPT